MKRAGLVLLCALALVVIAGCGGGRSAEKAESGGNTGELVLTDREVALKSLKSYKATWTYEWSGTKDGEAQAVKWVSTEAYTSEPKASHTRFEVSDSLQPDQSETTEFYQIGPKSYLISQNDGKAECSSFSSADNAPTQSMVGPNTFGSINGGVPLGTETVNGIRAGHYRYDEKATGLNLYEKLSGEIWVAVDGGYVVKDAATWEGRSFAALAGGDAATDVGKGGWTWELSDVNQAFEITPPPGCENEAEGLPVMADATDQASFGAMLTYKSKSKLAAIAKFYLAGMPKAGWTAEGEGQITDQFGTLTYGKDGKKATIVLAPEEAHVNVMITVE